MTEPQSARPTLPRRRLHSAARWALLVVVVGAVGYSALRGVSYAGRQRLASLGADFRSPDSLQAGAVLVSSGPRHGGAAGTQTLKIDLAQAPDVAALRRCIEPLGEIEHVHIIGARSIHAGDVAAILDSTRPQRLLLAKCETTTEIVQAIGRLTAPVELKLSNSSISTDAFSGFSATGPTIALNAFATLFETAALEGLMKCPRLREWSCFACTFAAPDDWSPPVSSSLERLVIRGRYPPRLDAWLLAAPHLQSLQLGGPLRALLFPEALTHAPALRELALTDARLDDAWMERFPELSQLTQLDLLNNKISVSGVASALDRSPVLETLRIDDCRIGMEDSKSLDALYPDVKITFVPCQ